MFSHEQPVGVKACLGSRMARQPRARPWVAYGGVVVHDPVYLLYRRDDVINHAQELQPLLTAVAVVAHGDKLTFDGIEGGNRAAVPLHLQS